MANAATTNFDTLIKRFPVMCHGVRSKPTGFIRQREHSSKTIDTIAHQPEFFLKISNYFLVQAEFRLIADTASAGSV
jgi:hypothetical protein